ncbi:restriction endonuclease [Azospirillum sp. YIM DDC1]|uniref:Restriction endonuclease n=1 Tax=Azospirillum aestuarii TaxID=2802052 RepID=A0ABS1I4E3_9PROT|nr:restriction endonuclease [Azospirillum aestuarii]MBK4721912.1 restriction endonuclease [Azospirillum aestuarii]
MPAYDFKQLSPQDFEDLTRDLLRAAWDTSVESFGPGPDQGIDLRFAAAIGVGIVQCKHFARSGFTKLLAHMEDEVLKVRRLSPDRYVLVTSLPLTPLQKDKLSAALAPHVRNTQDILGAGDLNSLLAKYPEVEKAHHKLWLTSTAVLERLVHAANHVSTDMLTRIIHRS